VRVGQGFDVHRLAPGRKLILGGVEIEHPLGLVGHSDADVLSHAMADALLGAADLGDLGRHFPDSDETFKGVSSLTLLALVRKLLDRRGLQIVNLDATLIAERPKIAPYVERMKERLAEALDIEAGRISIKATTTEGLGLTGRGEGMAALAVALVDGTGS